MRNYIKDGEPMLFKVNDKVLIDCGKEDDGSLGNGTIGTVVEVLYDSPYPYRVLRDNNDISLYYEEELTLVEE